MAVSFQSYNRIRAKVKYLNVSPNPAAAARYFFHCFVTKEVLFCAEVAYQRKVCDTSVPFVAWLHTLESHGLIEVKWASPHRYLSIHEGRALHTDFNEERSHLFETARASDVRSLSVRLSRMERGFERVSTLLDIPCDPPDYIEFFKALANKEETPF